MRLFVALELPPDVVRFVDDVGARAARPGLRRVAPETLHVTLAYLGPQPEPQPIREAFAAVPIERVVLGVGQLAWLLPTALAVDLEDRAGACRRLQAAVVNALSSFYAPDARPYRPHVTVARIRRGARVDDALPRIDSPPTFAATAMTLYRSRPGPKGARYDALARRDLP